MSLLWGRACIMTDLASLVQAEEDGEGVRLPQCADGQGIGEMFIHVEGADVGRSCCAAGAHTPAEATAGGLRVACRVMDGPTSWDTGADSRECLIQARPCSRAP